MCDYPTKALSGAGVVYKFCSYIDELLGTSYADDYVDLDGNIVTVEAGFSCNLNPWQYIILTDMD